MAKGLDTDIELMTRAELERELRRARSVIRVHEASQGHDLCWWWPELWQLLPEYEAKSPIVPPWNEFMQCCATFRASLERPLTLEEMARVQLMRAMVLHDGNIKAVALELGVSYKTIYNKLHEYGVRVRIPRESKEPEDVGDSCDPDCGGGACQGLRGAQPVVPPAEQPAADEPDQRADVAPPELPAG